MDALKEHTIPFSGLKDGVHEFRFELAEAFFAGTQDEDLEGGLLEAIVTLTKSPSLLVAEMHIEGPVRMRCDRCAAPMELQVSADQRQIFQLNAEEDLDSDEVVGLPPGEHSINLTHYLYECLRLALPIRHVHPPGQCDPEVEAVLERLAVDQEPAPDPRWDALKNLKQNPRS